MTATEIDKREEFQSLWGTFDKQLPNNCGNCGNKEDLTIHHIIPLSLGGNNVIGNMVRLCSACHGIVHGKKAVHHKRLQAEGIAISKVKGKYRGKKTKLVEGGEEEVRAKAIIQAYLAGTSIADIRKTYKVGTGTLYRLLEREGIKR